MYGHGARRVRILGYAHGTPGQGATCSLSAAGVWARCAGLWILTVCGSAVVDAVRTRRCQRQVPQGGRRQTCHNPGALLLAILRSLWIKWEPPEGERVTRNTAPELFQLLDELQGRLRTPPVHEV